MADIITKTATTDNPLSGSFTDLYDVFKGKVEQYHKALEKATSDWEHSATDPKLTLAMQAAQGDLGNLTRGLGSLISALVALQSEATQKIK